MKGLPEMKPVVSTNISAIGHRDTTLYVRFKGGGLYSYEGVPSDVFHAGLASESVGRWFASKVRGSFKHTQHDQ